MNDIYTRCRYTGVDDNGSRVVRRCMLKIFIIVLQRNARSRDYFLNNLFKIRRLLKRNEITTMQPSVHPHIYKNLN